MDRSFEWLWDNYKEGARTKFEEVCYQVYKSTFPSDVVKRVRVNRGDGGVDVYISHSNGDYTIIQCKFFRKEIGKSQKEQIRDSFDSAIENHGKELTKWVLCVPILLSDKEHNWWLKWKKEKEQKLSVNIELHDEDSLMDLVKANDLYDEYFNTIRLDKGFIQDMITEDEKTKIHNRIYLLVSSLSGVDYWIPSIITTVDSLMDLKAHRLFKNSNLLQYLEELTTLYAYHAHGNMIKDPKIEKIETELRIKIVEEYQKLDF